MNQQTLFKDDNAEALKNPGGMRPNTPGGLSMLSTTMTGSTQEFSSGATPTRAHGWTACRIVGTQPVLYAFGLSGQGASYTGVTNMIYVPAGVVEYARFDVSDASIYILQGGTGGTCQITFLS